MLHYNRRAYLHGVDLEFAMVFGKNKCQAIIVVTPKKIITFVFSIRRHSCNGSQSYTYKLQLCTLWSSRHILAFHIGASDDGNRDCFLPELAFSLPTVPCGIIITGCYGDKSLVDRVLLSWQRKRPSRFKHPLTSYRYRLRVFSLYRRLNIATNHHSTFYSLLNSYWWSFGPANKRTKFASSLRKFMTEPKRRLSIYRWYRVKMTML